MSQTPFSLGVSPSALRRATSLPCEPTFRVSSDEEDTVATPPERAPSPFSTDVAASVHDDLSLQLDDQSASRSLQETSHLIPPATVYDHPNTSLDPPAGIEISAARTTWGPPSPEVVSPPSTWPRMSNPTGPDENDDSTGSAHGTEESAPAPAEQLARTMGDEGTCAEPNAGDHSTNGQDDGSGRDMRDDPEIAPSVRLDSSPPRVARADQVPTCPSSPRRSRSSSPDLSQAHDRPLESSLVLQPAPPQLSPLATSPPRTPPAAVGSTIDVPSNLSRARSVAPRGLLRALSAHPLAAVRASSLPTARNQPRPRPEASVDLGDSLPSSTTVNVKVASQSAREAKDGASNEYLAPLVPTLQMPDTPPPARAEAGPSKLDPFEPATAETLPIEAQREDAAVSSKPDQVEASAHDDDRESSAVIGSEHAASAPGTTMADIITLPASSLPLAVSRVSSAEEFVNEGQTATRTDTRSSAEASSPGPSSSSEKGKDKGKEQSSSPTITPRPPVKKSKKPFQSPMVLSSQARRSPPLSPRSGPVRATTSSPPASPPPAPTPAPVKPKRPKTTFKALAVSRPATFSAPAPVEDDLPSPSTSAAESALPPPRKRKKAVVVPFQSPVGLQRPREGASVSQAREIAEAEKMVQLLKQALRFVGTVEGRAKEKSDSMLVDKWKNAGREIAQLLWDETPSSQIPSNATPSTSAAPPASSIHPSSGSSFFSSGPSPFLDAFPSNQSFADSFGFGSTPAGDPEGMMMDLTWESPLPSPDTVSREIDRTLTSKSSGGRIGLGVRDYLEDRRERREANGDRIDEEDEDDDEDDMDDDGEETEGAAEKRRARDRKRKRDLWNVGAMCRQRFGVDPELFGWVDELEDWA